jgi:hypothetical protein
MIKKHLFLLLFLSPYFLLAQRVFYLQADYVRLKAEHGELYFLHQKQADFQAFYANFKRKNNVFEQYVEREDTVSFASPASAKDFFKPEKCLEKQNVKQLMSQLMDAAFEVEDKTTKTIWQVMSKNIIAKSEYEKDDADTFKLENRTYFHYVITVLNDKYPFVSIRYKDDISAEFAALLPTKDAWKLCMNSLQTCKKVAKFTDFINVKHRYNNYYQEDEFSEFNTIFKKKGKFGLMDSSLQMIMIPPIYDSLFFLARYIACKKGRYFTFYNYFYEPYQAKNIRAAYDFGGSLQILQDNEVKWLNLNGTVTGDLLYGSSCGGSEGFYTRHFFKINQEKNDSSFLEYRQMPIRETTIYKNVTPYIDPNFQNLLKNEQIKPVKYEFKIKNDSIYLYCQYSQNCDEKQTTFNLTEPLKSYLSEIKKTAEFDLLMLKQKKDLDSIFIRVGLLFDTIQRFDISHIVGDGDLFFLNKKKEIEGKNNIFQLKQENFKINSTFVLVNKSYTKRSILTIDIVENKIKYEILAKDLDVIIPNEESNPIRFKQHNLHGFFPQNRKGEYEFLEDFIVYFARFQKPNGKKGWLDIYGNEFLD